MFHKETNFKEGTVIGKVPIDWEIVRIEKVCAFERGFSYRSEQVTTEPSKIRFITINDFEKEGGLKRNGESLYLKDETDVEPEYFLDEDEVLVANTDMSRGFIIGAPIYIEKAEGKFVYSMDLTRLVFDKMTVSGKFLFYLLKHEKIRSKMKTIAQGTNVLHLNHELMKKLKIPLPPLDEQRAIAGVLGVVDSVIAKTDEVIAKTERLKKGLMQTLLTRGIGHKEFKDTEIGRIPGEWEVVKLGDIANIIMGQSPPSSTYNKEGIGLPFLQGKMEFGEIYPLPIFYCSNPVKVAEDNDILISVRAPVGDVNLAPYKLCIGRGLAAIRFKNVANHLFYFYYLQKIKAYLEALGKGSTFKAIVKDDLENLKVPQPLLQEQQKIAEILSTVDKKLELERNEKARLEKIKQGMMDLLLTGKVRVKVGCDAVCSG